MSWCPRNLNSYQARERGWTCEGVTMLSWILDSKGVTLGWASLTHTLELWAAVADGQLCPTIRAPRDRWHWPSAPADSPSWICVHHCCLCFALLPVSQVVLCLAGQEDPKTSEILRKPPGSNPCRSRPHCSVSLSPPSWRRGWWRSPGTTRLSQFSWGICSPFIIFRITKKSRKYKIINEIILKSDSLGLLPGSQSPLATLPPWWWQLGGSRA